MGLTYVKACVEGIAYEGPPYEGKFLVDTGAIHCLAPASVLKKAGVREHAHDIYELANGKRVEYAYGYAFITFEGYQAVSRIIFGPEGVEPILGVIALEDVGMGVDPVTNKLKRVGALSLKKAA